MKCLAASVEELSAALSTPDGRGGGEFWLSAVDQPFPCLAIRVSQECSDVHYFPTDGHPGFRLLSEQHADGEVAFEYEGCDPGSGEVVPLEFVVPLSVALATAAHFMESGAMAEQARWYEL